MSGKLGSVMHSYEFVAAKMVDGHTVGLVAKYGFDFIRRDIPKLFKRLGKSASKHLVQHCVAIA